jgi:hypothetical protein
VVKINHTVVEPALLQQFEDQEDIVRKIVVPAPDDNRCNEQLVLIDQSGPDGKGGEAGTAHGDVMTNLCLHHSYSALTGSAAAGGTAILVVHTLGQAQPSACTGIRRPGKRRPFKARADLERTCL